MLRQFLGYVQVWYPDGTKTFTGFDAEGRRVAETNQDGIVTRFGYDEAGRLVAVTNAFGISGQQIVTQYQYDEAGNQTAQIDVLNRTTLFEYDSLGRRTKRILPGTQSETFCCDRVGNLVFVTNFNQVVITNQYDVLNRLTNRSSVGGYRVSFAYSPTGQRTNMTDPSGSTSYAYDARDRLALKTMAWSNGPTASLNYLYDPNGNLTNLWSSTSNGVSLRYEYDPLNRITNVLDNGAVAAGYGFYTNGNLRSVRYANGITNLYQYDALNRLTNLVWKNGSTDIANFAYQLGPAGNRTNLVECLDGSWRTNQWQYDSLYRLKNETISGLGNLGYGYDPVGNRTNRFGSGTVTNALPAVTNSFNANDWLADDCYDDNGNTTSSDGKTYQYDALDHIINVNTGAIVIAYDGDGNRVTKTVGSVTTDYLVDDRNPSGYAQVLEEWTNTTGTASLSRVYAYGLALISQRQVGSGAVHFYGQDGHGSVRFLADSTGSIANTYAYDAYGTLIASTGSIPNNYLYCGEQFDPDLGLYYLRARYFNPQTGRFWTIDSYEGDPESPLSLHKYLYCASDPVGCVDHSGRNLIDIMGRIYVTASIAAANLTAIAGPHAEAVAFLTILSAYQGVQVLSTGCDPETGERADVVDYAFAVASVLPEAGTIRKPLSTPVKKLYRDEARLLWDRLSKVKREITDRIHHRIPLEWSHIFPRLKTSRVANLQKASYTIHKKINKMWINFKTALDGRQPTAKEVADQAKLVDEKFGDKIENLREASK